jgi:hypothetical protein
MSKLQLALLIAVVAVVAGAAGAGIWLYSGAVVVLRLDEDVPVLLRGKIPFRAAIDQRVDVGMAKDIAANVELGALSFPIDTTFQAPLDFTLDVPIDTDVALDDTLDLDARVAIDTVLTERELDLRHLKIPIDTDVFVDDTIAIEVVVPVDSEVTTLLGVKVPVKMNVPVKTKVPIHQKVHIRDVIDVGVPKLRVPLHLTVPVRAQVPLKRSLRVRGNVRVPIKRSVAVPIKQLLHVETRDPIAVTVKLEGKLPAELKTNLDTEVTIDQAIPAHLGAIAIDPSELTLERAHTRSAKPAKATH